MRAGARVSTSAVSLGRYIEFFTECAKEGTPTVYLCFTSALSSSYNSACQAADAVRAEYPDFELYVVDNALPCATGALLALEAVRQRSAGLTAKQLVDWANEAKTYVHGYFTLESFDGNQRQNTNHGKSGLSTQKKRRRAILVQRLDRRRRVHHQQAKAYQGKQAGHEYQTGAHDTGGNAGNIAFAKRLPAAAGSD